jgi:hypothetical protein
MHNDEERRSSLETMTGLRTATFILAVRKINSSDEKWPNAMRYVNRAMS